MVAGQPSAGVSVEALMRELERGARRERQHRILARGGPPEYGDEELFGAVEGMLRRALEGRDPELFLFQELTRDEEDWRLKTHLSFSSHRRVLGPAIVFLKRRVLLPMTRWLYEYSLENFRRQERVNRMLFSCIEGLAIENARLRHDLQRQTGKV